MDKEFTPYTESLSLKELGFDEPCFAIYGKSEGDLFKVHTDKFDNVNELHFIKAPTFSQAFRWFREKYELDSEIYMNHESGVKFYTYLILQLDRAVITHKSGYTGKFNTYEEVELECLKKLIEIVKEK